MHRMSLHMEHFSSINRTLDHRTYVNEFWKTEITQSLITDHNGKKLEIKTEEKLEHSQVSQSRSVVSDSLWTQARILEWVAFPFSRGSSQPGDWIQVSHIAGGFFTSWATGEIIMENNSKQGSQYGHTSYLEASTGFWQSREAASSW